MSTEVRIVKTPKGQLSDLGYVIEHRHDGSVWHWPSSKHVDTAWSHSGTAVFTGPGWDPAKKAIYAQILAGTLKPFKNAPKAKTVTVDPMLEALFNGTVTQEDLDRAAELDAAFTREFELGIV